MYICKIGFTILVLHNVKHKTVFVDIYREVNLYKRKELLGGKRLYHKVLNSYFLINQEKKSTMKNLQIKSVSESIMISMRFYIFQAKTLYKQ